MKNEPLKTAEYFRLAREIESSHTSSTPALTVLATYSVELLRPFLIVESDRLGIPIRPWFGPFQQLEQMILEPQSALWQQQPSVIWIALRLQDVIPHFADDDSGIQVAEVQRRVVELTRAARQQFTGPILVSNFAVPWPGMSNWFDANDPDGLTHQISAVNRELAREVLQVSDAHVFDYARIVAETGAMNWTDPKLWFMARAAESTEHQPVLARAIARATAAVTRAAAKCIVVDLDNTLWGGVLGDDGIEGIQLGDDYPGNVFKDFQGALLGYQKRGFLLAAASKNDEPTVLEVFEKHPEMVLKREHFACLAINWEPKPVNLRRIAEQLNIGLDSLVFVDDNPAERGEVHAALPMVHVVDLPPSSLGFRAALQATAVLDRPRLLSDDRGRAEMYTADSRRREIEKSSTSVADYLAALEMQAEVGLCDATSLDRIHQLIQKTNQFNLTTRRHTLEAVRRMATSPECRVAWLRLRDRYGDLGLVCVGILRQDPDQPAIWEIDTFLMSCRVMGRHVEDAFLAYLAELARDADGQILRGVFIPTAKNTPVREFYAQHGFQQLPSEDSAIQISESRLDARDFTWPDVITVQKPSVTAHA